MAKNLHWIKKIDPNLVIAVGVLISSFAALFVYVRQARIMSEQSNILLEQTSILLEQTKASTWPHLSIEGWQGNNQDGRVMIFKIVVTNKGTGPAILEKTRISFDDVYVESWNDFYKVVGVPDSIKVFHSNQNIHNRVLASDERLELIDWSIVGDDPEASLLTEFIYSKSDRIKVEICYKSIHGDTWSVSRLGFKSDLEANDRVDLEDCSNFEGKIFLQ